MVWLGVAAEREVAALRAARRPGDVPLELIDVIVVSLADLGAIDWLPAIRQWHAEGLLDPTFTDFAAIEQNIAAPVDRALARLRSRRRGYVADAASEMSWWAMFDLPRAVAASGGSGYVWSSVRRPVEHDRAPSVREPVKPVVREQPKVGRNDPCPCGSGRKFKKCHGAA